MSLQSASQPLASTPTVHSEFGASSSHRWMACPGSVQLSRGMPNKSSVFAEEGTMLHDVAASRLTEDAPWPAGLTSEQIEVVMLYTQTVAADAEEGDTLLVEQRFHIDKLHPSFFGTADAVRIQPTSKTLRVYDLKCGAGVAVEVDYDGKINPQLGYYMLGAIASLGGIVTKDKIDVPNLDIENFEIIVVQPRAGGVKRRTVNLYELWELANELATAAYLAERPAPILKAGTHCKFCPAKPKCPEIRSQALRAAKAEFGGTYSVTADNMSDADLAEALDQVTLIETWLEAVKAEAKRRILIGRTVVGWQATARQGNRKWRDFAPEDIAEQLVAWGIPADKVRVSKLVSPAEVERLARIYVEEDIDLDGLVERSAGTPTLSRAKGKATATGGEFQREAAAS